MARSFFWLGHRSRPREMNEMNSREAIKIVIEMGEVVASGYLSDLTDDQWMMRPHPGCNHINWQVGHLIVAENHHLNLAKAGAAPPLPAGFGEKYTKETAANNDPAAFVRKDELLKIHAEQHAAVLSTLASLSDAELDRATGIEYAPTVGAVMSLQGSHWLMHAGQWVIVRRAVGKPALF